MTDATDRSPRHDPAPQDPAGPEAQAPLDVLTPDELRGDITLEHVEDTLERFFREYLDETQYQEYRNAERTIATLKAQGLTPSGVPRVRPSDCARALGTLRRVFQQFEPLFRTRDPGPIERFERLISDFSMYVGKLYPAEDVGVRMLHAEVHLLLNDPAGVEATIGTLAERPYLLQSSLNDFRRIIELRGRAMLLDGRIVDHGPTYLNHSRLIIRAGKVPALHVAGAFAAFLAAVRTPRAGEGLLSRQLVFLSRKLVRARRPCRSILLNIWLGAYRSFILMRMVILLRILAHLGDIRWLKPPRPAGAGSGPGSGETRGEAKGEAGDDLARRYLVTRAMGGIGDLLMMTPGLRALAAKSGRPVDLAVPKAFFPVFANNPNVRLIDINGAAVDTLAYRAWRNLSICPAARYESRHRPNVRKGRVELFARGMGIRRHQLTLNGWSLQVELDEEQKAFRDAFLKRNGIGSRPLVGVQPYSRDSYKDHPRIQEIILDLSRDHDILVLHHLAAGVPSGPGIWSTAGLSLSQSFAMVSALDAMVSVDSAFLHAAAAFDVPVVALFGPTDGRTFTRHHKRAKVVWKPERFGCSPCWRNEDLPCLLTNLIGISPCLSAISSEEILAELRVFLEPDAPRKARALS